MRFNNFNKAILMGACVFALSACSPLSKQERIANKDILRDNQSLHSLLEKESKKMEELKSSENWAFLSPYAAKENWDNKFEVISKKVETQSSTYKIGLKSATKANKASAYLSKEIGEVKYLKSQIGLTSQRAQDIINAKSKTPEIIANASKLVQSSDIISAKAVEKSLEGKEMFPNRSKDIESRLKPILNLNDEIKKVQVNLIAEVAKENPDFSKVVDFSDKIESINKSIESGSATFKSDVEGLSKDYTLVLKDMKAEYSVQLGFSSWSDYDDCCTNDGTVKPKKISPSDYEYLLSKQNLDSIATLDRGGKPTVTIDSNVWNRIGFSSINISGFHNNGTVWIEDLYPEYYHKYVEINGSKVSPERWEEVDEEDYALHLNNFGMAIESKAVGQFPDEAVEEAVPLGLDKVGNENYGQWKQDSNGNSFWHYYGQYAFFSSLLGNNTLYSRNDYSGYNSWRSARASGQDQYGYYGANRNAPRFGSNGSVTKSTPAYSRSPLKASGGAASAPRSLRNKASSMRNRGPRSSGK